MKYRSEIDGLRALAVVPVILFHAGFELFSGGFIGVDVFFVISGYLITTILIEDIENKRFSIVNFYERRARRILPALFFVMLVCIPFAWMWMLPNQMKDFSQSLVAVSLFASNILFWRESGYFDAAAEEKPLLHTWSLAVEEQYYLLFPIFLILAWRFGKNRVFWMIVVMATISLLLSEWGWRNQATVNFYLLPTRAWELFAGSIAAFIVQKKGVQKNNFLAILGLASIIFSIFIYDKTTAFPSVYALLPVLGVVLIILCADKETFVAKLLSTSALVGIGLISYSAYLWHQPLFAFARLRLLEHPSQLLMLTLSMISFCLAFISWLFIEKPFRNSLFLKNRFIFLTLLTLLLFFSFIGFLGHKTNGFIQYNTTQQYRNILITAASSPKSSECNTGGSNFLNYDASCEYFSDNVSVAVIGDSHATELSYALADELREEDVGIKHLSFPGCPPSYNIVLDGSDLANIPDFEHCVSWTQQVVDGLISDESIDNVIISYRISASLYGNASDPYPSLVDRRGDVNRNMIWKALLDMIQTLNNAGKNTIFVMQSPELPRLIGHLIPSDVSESVVGVPLGWWKSRMAYVYQNIDALQTATEVIDPTNIFCDEINCYAVLEQQALYFDDHHPSVEGARLVAREIIPRLLISE